MKDDSKRMAGQSVAAEEMIARMRTLWPICRSITGEGVRKTLQILKEELPGLGVYEVATGTKCFDWVVPEEWNIQEAYIRDPEGNTVVDFADHNLHVVSYSVPVNREMDLNELQQHLYSIPEQPDAIPYITSYYRKHWGFCIQHNTREKLRQGMYKVVINSTLSNGSLTYGELYLPGKTQEEIFFSTYICHPSMANNELSGPCLATQLAKHLSSMDHHYSYRFIFVPETIGAICYLSLHLEELKRNVKAGFVLTCVGDERAWSYMPSIMGNTYSDRICMHVMDSLGIPYDHYSFLERGSDERQYCSPGIDLPVCSVMRSKYMTYPEYHTSLDDLTLVTGKGMGESFEVYSTIIEAIESDIIPFTTVLCEPKLSDRGLRSPSPKGLAPGTMDIMNVLAYANGQRSLLDIAGITGKPVWELRKIADLLHGEGLLSFTTEKRVDDNR